MWTVLVQIMQLRENKVWGGLLTSSAIGKQHNATLLKPILEKTRGAVVHTHDKWMKIKY